MPPMSIQIVEPIAAAVRQWATDNCREGSVTWDIVDTIPMFTFSSYGVLSRAEAFIAGFKAGRDCSNGIIR